MLKLPDVTLVCVETREHALAAMAVRDCLKVAEFGSVLILTDKPGKWSGIWTAYPQPDVPAVYDVCAPNITWHPVPDWPNKLGWSRSWWHDVPPLLRTRQTLNIQWDSWIWDASMWRDEFMEYDYIGAPWWYKDGKNVGNGGFSLVSTRLKRYLWKHRAKFPCDTNVDDDLLCRKYRPQLEEEAGFKWAPERVAYDFSYEGCMPTDKPTKHFGFHAMFNWPYVLERDALMARLEVAIKSPYISKSYMMQAFCGKHPKIMRKFLATAKRDPISLEGTNNG